MSQPQSLSLMAYRILSWRMPKKDGRTDLPRPTGEVMWVHIADPNRLRVIVDLCERLKQVRPGLSVLLTAPPDADLSRWTETSFPLITLPLEHTGAARSFLDHWHPDMGLWVGGGLMPSIITRAAEQKIPLILIEATPDVSSARLARWLPDISRYTFNCFDHILTPSEEIARQIRRLGIPSSKVEETPPLQISPNPKPWPEDELIEVTHTLSSRPVWLAAWVQDKEFISVLSAHRQALRMMPRLVLVLHVADMGEAQPLQRRLASMDLRCSNWDEGNQIEDATQVILTSEPEDLGLWQRVCPVTFMGSSLERGAGGCDPLETIALGSAIVHGPFVHRYQGLYDQLEQIKAARMIKSATELGDAVAELLAPDQAAGMALAGWQMITEGAPQADRLIEMVQDALDQRSSDNAST
ncbi:glycosyltransferase N-terminal domain-containing protein [Ruegeria sp. SCPT10]|uniref:3-deoxy-D-manno-octulosonic acid transferase n=1 Tax=Ruegeria sp. SCP10 TaxID=3141377 RepID=UPI00333E0152